LNKPVEKVFKLEFGISIKLKIELTDLSPIIRILSTKKEKSL